MNTKDIGATISKLRKEFENGISEFAEMRYDCVTIDAGRIGWIKNAFEHVR